MAEPIKNESVPLSKGDLERAMELLYKTTDEGIIAFKVWQKNNPGYKIPQTMTLSECTYEVWGVCCNIVQAREGAKDKPATFEWLSEQVFALYGMLHKINFCTE